MTTPECALELNATAAKILAERRDELGISLRQIEEKSGVNYMTVKRVLDGTREMRMDDFQAIANALGLSAWRVVQQAEESATFAKVIAFHPQEEDMANREKLAAAKHSHSRYHEGQDEDEISQQDP